MNTREVWLQKAIENFKSGLFKRHGYEIPVVRVSVGFPGGGSARKRIGEHWSPNASDDKIGSIFISPVLGDGVKALDVLVHELVHAVMPAGEGHGKLFKRCALAVGLTGKMRSTVAGPELIKELNKLIKKLGPYPHAKLNLNKSPIKKQTTRMIKMECGACGYIARTSQTNLDLHGPVLCPCNDRRMDIA
jgi:hypothetical protein